MPDLLPSAKMFKPRLSPQQARIFDFLSSRRDHVSKKELVHFLHRDDPNGGPLFAEEIIRTQIMKIRKKIKKAKAPFTIDTWWGVGYRLSTKVK